MSRPVAIPMGELDASEAFFAGTPQSAKIEIALTLLLKVTDPAHAERLDEVANLLGRHAHGASRVAAEMEVRR